MHSDGAAMPTQMKSLCSDEHERKLSDCVKTQHPSFATRRFAVGSRYDARDLRQENITFAVSHINGLCTVVWNCQFITGNVAFWILQVTLVDSNNIIDHCNEKVFISVS